MACFEAFRPPCCSRFTACGFTPGSLWRTEMFCCFVMFGSVIQLWLSQQNMVSVSPPSARARQTGVFVRCLVCSPPWIGEFFEMHSTLRGGGLCVCEDYPRREKSTETSGPPQGYTKICSSSFSFLTFSGLLWFFTSVDRFLLAVSQLCQDKIIQ